MAQQPDAEGRAARRIRLQRPRRHRRDLPAGPGGARGRRGDGAQQQRRDSRGFGRQRQAPARRQVEQARLAPGLDQHCAQRGAARGFRARPQHAAGVARPHQQEAIRVEAELGQPRRMRPPGLGLDDVLPDPEDRALVGRPQRQPQGKTRRRREIRHARRMDLVQRRPCEPAAERLVESRQAEADVPCRSRSGPQGRISEMAAQL